LDQIPRRFISTTALISSSVGPLGLGAISLGGGFSARNISSASHLSGTTQQAYIGGPTVPVDLRYSDSNRAYGLVFAAGISFRAGIIHLQPELRYIRLKESPLASGKLDSFQALIGISAGRGGANTRF
jgi:hypothetical protein